jgi:protease YdgD
MKLLRIILAANILASCGSQPGASTTENVFGFDDRELLVTPHADWKAIGRISTGSGYCTGTLVGKNLVITSASCVIDPTTDRPMNSKFTFTPNLTATRHLTGNVVSSAVTNVWTGTADSGRNMLLGWAILYLEKPLGDEFGWMGVRNVTAESFPEYLTVAGYSQDFADGLTAGIHRYCSTRKRSTGRVLHDCDTKSTGSPVLEEHNGKISLVGIHVARNGIADNYTSYQDAYANIAIPSASFMDSLLYFIENGNRPY